MASTGSSSSAAMPETAPAAADLAIGIVTYNHVRAADAIGHAVRTVLTDLPAVTTHRIFVADAGSLDGTVARLRGALGGGELVEVPVAAHPGDVIDLPFHGVPGRARALKGILQEATARGP